MKKHLLVITMLVSLAFGVSAQKSDGGKLSFGLDGGATLGTTRDIAQFALGVSLKYDQPVAANTFITFSGGYSYLPYTEDFKINSVGHYGTTTAGESYIPLKAGVKYFINNGFYAEAQAGTAISTQSGGGAAFAYAPGIGVTFDKYFDFGVRFEGWTKSGNSINQIAARLAYCF